ncbi:hypothetical protein TIFTF001_022954 [Ficus carica]|uniref:Uncharacterized protein n=1 Tax=Ficus carica TaxID=3494 RepID=A0AA88DC48_FICCA|nr:hypothetical protein TIFTF001_022954 [Ficus carica]
MHRRKGRRSRQRHRRGSRLHRTATALLDALDALDAVDGAVERGLALALGPLEAALGEAVAAVVEVDTLLGREVGANAAFLAEEVVRDGEVGEVGKHADAVEEISGHYVVGEVELLEVRKPTSSGKQPDKLVLIRRSSSRVLAKLTMLLGRHPP